MMSSRLRMTDQAFRCGGDGHMMRLLFTKMLGHLFMSCGISRAGHATRVWCRGPYAVWFLLLTIPCILRGWAMKVGHNRKCQDRDINRRSVWEPPGVYDNSRAIEMKCLSEAVNTALRDYTLPWSVL